MPLTQYQAVTGRRLPVRYPSVAPAGYLAGKTALERSQKYNDAILEAENRRMALEERSQAENARIALENQKLSEQQANTANLIGLGGLAGNLYLGSQMGGGAGKAAQGASWLSRAGGAAMKPIEAAKTGLGNPTSGVTMENTILSPRWIAGTAAGTVAAPWLADQGVIPFGGKAEKEIAGAALASGVVTGLMTWDPYSAIASALTAGGITALRKWL